uniref:AAA domain-containing protein n=1 Tax=Trichuris muris TaxID=70415 RepID=A0A5S6Q838_TRIMR
MPARRNIPYRAVNAKRLKEPLSPYALYLKGISENRKLVFREKRLVRQIQWFKLSMKKFDKVLSYARTNALLIGEVLNKLDDDRIIVALTNGTHMMVGCRNVKNKSRIEKDARVAIDSSSLAIMAVLPQIVDINIYKMAHQDYSTVSFEMIGGLEEEIRSVREVIEMPLAKPEIFQRVGIKPPKGVLLYGPPGTGKTLIAKAIASQLKYNFLKIVSSGIIDKYIGQSARVIREMFTYAKQNEPCIIFIDEIDAIGSKRQPHGNSADREIQRTMLELLHQMDGFNPLQKVKVIMATNRPDALDPALLRPGRLDRKIEVPLPNQKARLEILKVHLKNVNKCKSIDLTSIVHMTEGLNGADLRNVVTEAGYNAIRDDRDSITQSDLSRAIRKVREMKKSEVAIPFH